MVGFRCFGAPRFSVQRSQNWKGAKGIPTKGIRKVMKFRVLSGEGHMESHEIQGYFHGVFRESPLKVMKFRVFSGCFQGKGIQKVMKFRAFSQCFQGKPTESHEIQGIFRVFSGCFRGASGSSRAYFQGGFGVCFFLPMPSPGVPFGPSKQCSAFAKRGACKRGLRNLGHRTYQLHSNYIPEGFSRKILIFLVVFLALSKKKQEKGGTGITPQKNTKIGPQRPCARGAAI